MSEGEYITQFDEELNTDEPLLMFHPVHTIKRKLIYAYDKVEYVKDIYTVEEIKERLDSNLAILWEEYKRFLNPEEYPVDLSRKLWQIKQDLIEDASNKKLE